MEQAQLDNNKSSIIEALAEIRFDIEMPVSVFLGKIYDDLIALYPEFQQLPINLLPSNAVGDLNLKDAPYYRFTNKDQLINVGPTMISVNQVCTSIAYRGWSELRDRINHVISILKDKEVIDGAKGLNLRYINFFQAENFKAIVNVKAEAASCTLENSELFAITLASRYDNVRSKVAITSDAQAIFDEGQRKGQLIDLECSYESKVPIDDWDNKLNSLHDQVKDLFFKVMSKEYLSRSEIRQ
jgi:uncharacterized protein (TIGR04255 family)